MGGRGRPKVAVGGRLRCCQGGASVHARRAHGADYALDLGVPRGELCAAALVADHVDRAAHVDVYEVDLG